MSRRPIQRIRPILRVGAGPRIQRLPWVVGLVCVASLSACSASAEVDPRPSAETRVPACGPSAQSEPALSELVGEVQRVTGDCPSAAQIEDLRFVAERNGEFWESFPAQRSSFVAANFGPERETALDPFVGQPIAALQRSFESDEERPLTLARGPIGDADPLFFEFEGGLSLYLVSTRSGVVSGIYALDLG